MSMTVLTPVPLYLPILFATAEDAPPPAVPSLEDQPPSPYEIYRISTCKLLRRYFRISLQVGRLPTGAGLECFRTRVTDYRSASFEDAAIFVLDMEHCLARLSAYDRDLIARMVFQRYSPWETAQLRRQSLRTVRREFPLALDHLSQILLAVGILRPLDV